MGIPRKDFKAMVQDSFLFEYDEFEILYGTEIARYYNSMRKFRRDEKGEFLNNWLNGLIRGVK